MFFTFLHNNNIFKRFNHHLILSIASLFLGLACMDLAAQTKLVPPHLVVKEGMTQLYVKNQPFLILGGELGNSSAASSDTIKNMWPRLQSLNLNTVLAPVYWDLIEPQQNLFDFKLVDDLITQARVRKMKLVLLWFGSWKNSMSSYAPSWVKRDTQNYPRVFSRNGNSQEILSPFYPKNLEADRHAYAALLEHIESVDAESQTVLMIQVENEIGMLPDARDFSPAANKAFTGPVPKRLMDYLVGHKAQLAPELSQLWQTNGSKTTGTWVEVFGDTLAAEEIFMAWYLADYANSVALAGQAAYPLPTFVNAALINIPGAKPGQYPSGGPLPHLFDIWKAAAPAIDLLSPDFYNPNFQGWNDLYTAKGDALFIPEIQFQEGIDTKAIFAFGKYNCIGYSPFSIDTSKPEVEPKLREAYRLLAQLAGPLTQTPPTRRGAVLLTKAEPEGVVTLGRYKFTFRHDHSLGWTPESKAEVWPEVAGLIIQIDEEDFLVAGTGIVVTVTTDQPEKMRAGIDTVDAGELVNGQWTAQQRLNGDQTHQGRHLRIPFGTYGIQRLKVYHYPRTVN